MTLRENIYGVWLYDSRIGTLAQRGDFTQFFFNEDYLANGTRPVLGLRFEQHIGKRYSSALRLPPWFSNLLPESPLRDWIARDKGVSADREMELLARVGHDLPGAVRIMPTDDVPHDTDWNAKFTEEARFELGENAPAWRFSLAGVALKFSMMQQGDRLTLPAYGMGGDWIVKTPDPRYPHVPRNEYAMMTLASASGINVPKIRLIHRDDLGGLPQSAWPNDECWAFAIERFDRPKGGQAVHIEDLAQVRDVLPDRKYDSTFETAASLIYRRRHTTDLEEFARRLAFNVLVQNGDAHLKNWSLIYKDRRSPRLSPVYDIVSTAPYREKQHGPEDLGMKFSGSRRISDVSLDGFRRLQRKLDSNQTDLPEHVRQLIRKTIENWETLQELLSFAPSLRSEIGISIKDGSRSLLR